MMKRSSPPAIDYYSDEILEAAFDWLCQQRQQASPHDSVWLLRQNWPSIKAKLQAELKAGVYRFEALTCYPIETGYNDMSILFYWSALDSLVQKCLALALLKHLKDILAPTCMHVKGHGGSKKAVSEVKSALSSRTFFYRTDVKSYYQSIDLKILMRQLKSLIQDRALRRILYRFLHHSLTFGGLFADNKIGLPMGSPLSPVLSALYLLPLDKAMAKEKVFYRRFQDDWVILSEKRWVLNRAKKRMYDVLESLHLVLRPEKNQVGRLGNQCFHFLGFLFDVKSIAISPLTQARCVKKIGQLFKRKQPKSVVLAYITRWRLWARAGVDDVTVMPLGMLLVRGALLFVCNLALGWFGLFRFMEYLIHLR